jgi:hypothetical protein
MDPEKLEWFRRNSRVGLKADGQWTFDGQLVENPRVQNLFHRGLQINEDGEATLHVGTQWCYLEEVEDTLFFVENLHIEAQQMHLRLAGGATEALPFDTLTHKDGAVLYCRLSNGHKARLLRAAYQALADFFEERDGDYALRLDEQLYPIATE